MTSVSPPPIVLVISESAPARITMARLGEPAFAIAARNPSPMDRTATNTITTPAIPITANAEELKRCGIVRTLSDATVRVCDSHRTSCPPKGVGDAQPHSGHRRQGASHDPERAAEAEPDQNVAIAHDEDRQKGRSE